MKNLFIILLLVSTLFLFGATTESQKSENLVIEVAPSSLEIMVNSFDYVFALFIQNQTESEFQSLKQEFNQAAAKIKETYFRDNSIFVTCNITDDQWNKLSLFNRTVGYKLIVKNTVYELGKANPTVDDLAKFYGKKIHPYLPLAHFDEVQNLQHKYVLGFAFNSSAKLQNYTYIYDKIKKSLKQMDVIAVGLPSIFQNSANKILLFKNGEVLATYQGNQEDLSELKSFVNQQTLPIVSKIDLIDNNTLLRVFGEESLSQIMLIYEKDNENHPTVQSVREQFTKAAHYNKYSELYAQRVIFCEANSDFANENFDNIAENLGEKLFKIVYTKLNFQNFQFLRYNYHNQEFSKDKILEFIDEIRMKRINPQYKSQNIPKQEENTQILRKIVGKSFISQIYEKPDQSIIVLFIDSKDGIQTYSQTKKTLEEFLTKYENVLQNNVVGGIFDLNLNEHQLLTIKVAPTIVLFEKANKKHARILKEGSPTVQSLAKWVQRFTNLNLIQNAPEAPLQLGSSSNAAQNIEL